MDIKVLKKECNDLIDELESLQRTDANLDQQIRELQNHLEKKRIRSLRSDCLS